MRSDRHGYLKNIRWFVRISLPTPPERGDAEVWRNIYQQFAQFYWSPCDSWAAFCAVRLRLHPSHNESLTILNTKSSSPTEKTSIIRVLHQAHQPACWIIFQRSLPIKLFAGGCWGAWNVCGEEPWVWILDGLKHMFFQRKRQGFLGMVTKSCAWFIWFMLLKVYPQSGAVRRSDVFGVFLSHGIYCGYQLDVLLRHAWHLSCIVQ